MKLTNIFTIAMSVIVLASCSTSSDVVDGGLFQKRKYNKGYHISQKTKINKVSKDLEAAETQLSFESTNDESSRVVNKVELDTTVNSIIESADIAETQINFIENNQNAPAKENGELNVADKHKKAEHNLRLTEKANKFLNSRIVPQSSSNISVKQESTSNGSLMNLILAVVLVVAIIMLLSFIDGVLGGLLSLVLLIVIIYLLLKYFGII